MRKRDLAKRPDPAELQTAAAEWGRAATQMLLAMNERIDVLERRVLDLAQQCDGRAVTRLVPARRRRRRTLALCALVRKRTRGTE